MPVVALRPIIHRDSFTESVAKPIAGYFTEAVFGPLLAYLRENGVHPDAADQAIAHAKKEPESAVKRALLAGVIWYADGVFSGKFNAKISRELRAIGATFSNGVFRLAEDKLPLDIRGAVVYSAQQAAQLHQGVLDLIDEMQANAPKAPLGIETGPQVEKIVENLDKQFDETVPKVTAEEAPSAPAEVVAKRSNEILQIQIQEPIRNFTSEQLADLRSRVQANAVANGRADKLAKIIEARYGVAKRKAKFLAEQETSLLVSRYRERRYKSIGIQRYKWSTSHDERVRKDHRKLNGTVHDWAVKPISDRRTGARNHPGEDFNCFPADSRIEFDGFVKKGFRRWFSGELAFVVLESGETIRATKNHPVLTVRGWKPIGSVNNFDHLIQLSDDLFLSGKANVEGRVSMLGQVFESLWKSGLGETFSGKCEQFHGDGTDGDVDVVRAARLLGIDGQTCDNKSRDKLVLTQPLSLASGFCGLASHSEFISGGHGSSSIVGCSGEGLSLLEGHSTHANPVGFRTGPDSHSIFNQTTPNDDSLKTCAFRNGKLTFPGHVGFNDRFWVELQAIMSVTAKSVVATGTESFSGHVFNLETELGYYTTQNVIVSNCRCVPIPLRRIPDPQ